jgi:ribonuclease Z
VDHAPIEPAYAYRFDYKGRSAVVTGDLKNHPPLVKAAARGSPSFGGDFPLDDGHARARLQQGGRASTAAIMHDMQDYHISPEEAAKIANRSDVNLLAFYHLLPAPDGFVMRRLFAQGVDAARNGDWTIADDGSLYTLPLDSGEIKVGRIDE